MNVRVFELSISIPLLIITIIMLTIFLYFRIQDAQRKIFIPMMISAYGFIYSQLQYFVLSAGYDGIVFALISLLFVFLFIISMIYAIVKTFKSKKK